MESVEQTNEQLGELTKKVKMTPHRNGMIDNLTEMMVDIRSKTKQWTRTKSVFMGRNERSPDVDKHITFLYGVSSDYNLEVYVQLGIMKRSSGNCIWNTGFATRELAMVVYNYVTNKKAEFKQSELKRKQEELSNNQQTNIVDDEQSSNVDEPPFEEPVTVQEKPLTFSDPTGYKTKLLDVNIETVELLKENNRLVTLQIESTDRQTEAINKQTEAINKQTEIIDLQTKLLKGLQLLSVEYAEIALKMEHTLSGIKEYFVIVDEKWPEKS